MADPSITMPTLNLPYLNTGFYGGLNYDLTPDFTGGISPLLTTNFTGNTGSTIPSYNFTGGAIMPSFMSDPTGMMGSLGMGLTSGSFNNFSSTYGAGLGFGYPFSGGFDYYKYQKEQEEAAAKLKKEQDAKAAAEQKSKIDAAKNQVRADKKNIDSTSGKLKTEQQKLKDKHPSSDDKKFGAGDWMKVLGKSAGNMVADLFTEKDKNGKRKFCWWKTALTVVAGTAAVVFAPVCAPLAIGLTVLGVAGGVMGAFQMNKGLNAFKTAKTYDAKEKAAEQVCEGGISVGLTVADAAASIIGKISKVSELASGLKAATKGLPVFAADTNEATIAARVTKLAAKIGRPGSKTAEIIKEIRTLLKTDGLNPNLANLLESDAKVAKALDKLKLLEAATSPTKGIDFANKAEILKDLETVGSVLKEEKLSQAGLIVDGLKTTVSDLTKLKNPPNVTEITKILGTLETEMQGGKNIAKINEAIEELNAALKGLGNFKGKVNIIKEIEKITSAANDKNLTEIMSALDELGTTATDEGKVRNILNQVAKLMENTSKGKTGISVTPKNQSAISMLKTNLELAQREIPRPTLGELVITAGENTGSLVQEGLTGLGTSCAKNNGWGTVPTLLRFTYYGAYRANNIFNRPASMSLYDAQMDELKKKVEKDGKPVTKLETELTDDNATLLEHLQNLVDLHNQKYKNDATKQIDLAKLIKDQEIDEKKDSALTKSIKIEKVRAQVFRIVD